MVHISRTATRLLNHISIAFKAKVVGDWVFRITLLVLAVLCGFAWYQRTINMWHLKNIADTFISKDIGTRQIILGSFFRQKSEQSGDGRFAVIHFLGDARMEHPLYCFSRQPDNSNLMYRAKVQRIHKGKRAANDVCSWAGHIAECQLEVHTFKEFRISTTPNIEDSMLIAPEQPIKAKRQELVVCAAPMYTYTDWEIMLVGIETWLAQGATKIVIPIQSVSSTAYKILQDYERKGLVILRHWPKWPVLSDSNPNGLVLSRGIEESHVNCLFFVKPWANMVVFTDIDDMLLPADLSSFTSTQSLETLHKIFDDHPQAGSLLFEHRDTQFRLPSNTPQSLASFNFDFLKDSKTKQNCNVWRMKTRVIVNASRVDSVNMHETGIHRFGFVQTRVPCRDAHFYHLRHSHAVVSNAVEIDMSPLANVLNRRWQDRLQETFAEMKDVTLNKSSTESFEDFDRCMGAINEEHWGMSVSRCLTPHVCYSRLKRDVDCMASVANYGFFRSGSGYFIVPSEHRMRNSQPNCESPTPVFDQGNHYFSP